MPLKRHHELLALDWWGMTPRELNDLPFAVRVHLLQAQYDLEKRRNAKPGEEATT